MAPATLPSARWDRGNHAVRTLNAAEIAAQDRATAIGLSRQRTKRRPSSAPFNDLQAAM